MSEIRCYGILTPEPGKLEDLKGLLKEMVAHVQETEKGKGTLAYDYYVDEDGGRILVHEHYASSEAVLRHIEDHGARFGDRLPELLAGVSMELFGEPSEELLAKSAEFGKPTVYPTLARL